MTAVVSFGKYELVSRLARGGMAETYRAQLRGAAGVTKQVVIKKVLPEYGEDKDFIEAFINEAKVSASLSHGNIAQVFDFGEVDGDYFIAMELVDGRSLVEVLFRAAERGFPTLPVPIACFITIETLKGLHYAHTRLGEDGRPLNIVHRDISPENVLVAFSGNTKVVDFGVAKAALHGRKETEPGKVKGKFQYLSPEQARGEPLDGRSDVFAVGIILYRMLCGVLPFEGQMHLVMRAIADGKFVPPASVNPALPPTLVAVIEKAMAARREDRYASALQMHEALSRILYRDEPTFSEEAVKEWMTWLFRPELQGEGRAVSVSKKFESQLARWDPHGPKHATSQAIRKVKPGRPSRAPLWFAGAALLIAATVGVVALVRPTVEPKGGPKAVQTPDTVVFPAPVHVSAARHRLKLPPTLPEVSFPTEITGSLYERRPNRADAPLFAISRSSRGDGQVFLVLREGTPGLLPFSGLRFFDFAPFGGPDVPDAGHSRELNVWDRVMRFGAAQARTGGAWVTVTSVKGRARLTLTPDDPRAWELRARPPSVVVAWRRAEGPPPLQASWPDGPNRAVLTEGAPLDVRGAAAFAIAFADPLAAGERDSVTVSFEAIPEPVDAPTASLIVKGQLALPPLDADAGAAEEPPAEPADVVPLVPAAREALARAREQFAARDLPAAKASAKKCLAAQPGNYECHRLLGNVHAKLGAHEEGIAEYREFVRLAPDGHPDLEKVKGVLRAWDANR